jgi:hypothetical protein
MVVQRVGIHTSALRLPVAFVVAVRHGILPGLGGRMLIKETPEIAARIPFGLQINIADSRLGLFFELVPMLNLYPETDSDFDVNDGLGIRFHF